MVYPRTMSDSWYVVNIYLMEWIFSLFLSCISSVKFHFSNPVPHIYKIGSTVLILMGVVWENKLDDRVFWHIVGAHQTSTPFPSKVCVLTLFLMLEGCCEPNNSVCEVWTEWNEWHMENKTMEMLVSDLNWAWKLTSHFNCWPGGFHRRTRVQR